MVDQAASSEDDKLTLEGLVEAHADVLRCFDGEAGGAWRVNVEDEVAIVLRRFASAGLVDLNEFELESRRMYRPRLTSKGCVWLSIAGTI